MRKATLDDSAVSLTTPYTFCTMRRHQRDSVVLLQTTGHCLKEARASLRMWHDRVHGGKRAMHRF